jgi:hypothetical protein
MPKMTPKELADAPFKDHYDEWCRAQYQMAHHDIWWVKGQQMNAANWTLALLSALVGLATLLGYSRTPPVTTLGVVLSGLSMAIALLGSLYVWDLYRGLVTSRRRAKFIADRIADHQNVFAGARAEPGRHPHYPVIVTFIFAVALALVLYYFGTLSLRIGGLLALVWILVTVGGLWLALRPPDEGP